MDTTVNHSTAETGGEAVQHEAAQDATPVPEVAAEATTGAAQPDGAPVPTLAQIYEGHRASAVMSLDHLAAAVQLLSASVRWNAGDAAAVGAALAQAEAHLASIRWDINARAQILAGDEAARQEPAPEEPAPAQAPDPVRQTPSFSLLPEGHLVGTVRALEAAKTSVEQALMGLQFAPRETGMIFDVLDGLQSAGARASQGYLDYALALDTGA